MGLSPKSPLPMTLNPGIRISYTVIYRALCKRNFKRENGKERTEQASCVSLNPAIHIFLSPCTVGVLSEAMSLLLFSTSSIIVNFKKIEEYRLSNPLILLIIRKVWLYKIKFRKNEKRKTINSERTLSFPVARP